MFIFSYLKLFFKTTFNIGFKVFVVVATITFIVSLGLYFMKGDQSQTSQKTTPAKDQASEYIYTFVNDPKLNATKSGRTQIQLYRSMMCVFVGEVCTNNPKDAEKNYNKSLMGSVTGLIALPFQHPPASGINWIASTIKDAGFIPNTYAAEGVGFASIKGYVPIWKLFRDLAYLVLVLVVIILGFLIMFRIKLSPQTVISIETALPRIVITLLLITFSFAIAGILIDLMYVLIALVIYIFSQLDVGYLSKDSGSILKNINDYIGGNVGMIWPKGGGEDAMATGNSFFNILPDFIQGTFKATIGVAGAVIIAKLTNFFTSVIDKFAGVQIIAGGGASFLGIGGSAIGGGSLGALPGIIGWVIGMGVFLSVLAFIPGFILGLFILLTVLLLTFRIFFMLLMAYIKILLMIIFSPIILLAEALPGKNVFTGWLKGLLSELLTFPLVILLSLASYAIVNIVQISPTTNNTLLMPFLGGFSAKDFSIIVGMGVVLLTPDLIKLVKTSLGIKDLPLNAGVGTFFGGGAAAMSIAKGGVAGVPSLVNRLPYGLQTRLRGALRANDEKSGFATGFFGSWLGDDTTKMARNRATSAVGAAVTGTPAATATPTTPPPCLALNTTISTSNGEVKVQDITLGMLIWSVNKSGSKIIVRVIKVSSIEAPQTHKVVRLRLKDNREVYVSPMHPAINKLSVGDLKIGDSYSGSVIIESELVTYTDKKTYDILPDGETGFYFANGILLASTLK